MEHILTLASVLTPIITSLVELCKRTNIVSARFLPIAALILGIILASLALFVSDSTWYERLWAGLLSGLAATGLYELGGNAVKKTKTGDDEDNG